MAVMSPPVLVASSAAQSFDFKGFAASCNVQVRFYSDAEGTVEIAPGAGSRDITATSVLSAYEGDFGRPTATLTSISTEWTGGVLIGAVDGVAHELLFGAGAPNVVLSAAPNVTPGGALTYRLFVSAVSI